MSFTPWAAINTFMSELVLGSLTPLNVSCRSGSNALSSSAKTSLCEGPIEVVDPAGSPPRARARGVPAESDTGGTC